MSRRAVQQELGREYYMPVHPSAWIHHPMTNIIPPYSLYPFPYQGHYMLYSHPAILRNDCECDPSETYRECIFRKRMFHCDNDYDGTSYYK